MDNLLLFLPQTLNWRLFQESLFLLSKELARNEHLGAEYSLLNFSSLYQVIAGSSIQG